MLTLDVVNSFHEMVRVCNTWSVTASNWQADSGH